MKRFAHFFILLSTCIPIGLAAQDNDSKYLAGAVPVVDGKVVFSRTFNLAGAQQDAIYDRMLDWATQRMKQNGNNSRVVYTDKEKGSIAAIGEEYIVFKSSALSLDRTIVNYQLTVDAQPDKCLVEIEKIRYAYQDNERYSAEEWITDEVALNKAKTKLNRGIAKFRTKTVDFAEDIFDSAEAALGIAKVQPVVQASLVSASLQPVVVEQDTARISPEELSKINTPRDRSIPKINSLPVASNISFDSPAPTPLSGYRQIAPDKIPGNIIKMLNNDWMLITAGDKDKFNMMTASWGGLGMLYGKPTATCYINPTRYTYQLMEKNDTFTLTFYTEAYREALQYCGTTSGRDTNKVAGSGLTPITTPDGSPAFGEAWLIIECRKLVSQSLTPEAIANEEVRNQWAGKQLHKMYIGEIVNVWVK